MLKADCETHTTRMPRTTRHDSRSLCSQTEIPRRRVRGSQAISQQQRAARMYNTTVSHPGARFLFVLCFFCLFVFTPLSVFSLKQTDTAFYMRADGILLRSFSFATIFFQGRKKRKSDSATCYLPESSQDHYAYALGQAGASEKLCIAAANTRRPRILCGLYPRS